MSVRLQPEQVFGIAGIRTENLESCFRCALTDEMGLGARSVYYAVEPVKHEPRRRRRASDGAKPRQLALVAPLDGAR